MCIYLLTECNTICYTLLMNIPKKLHIGGHDFKVEIKKMEQGEAGQCSYNKT